MTIKVVNEYSANEMETRIGNADRLIVLYYMNGCGACSDLQPKWETVIRSVELPNNTKVIEIESYAQRYVKNLLDIPEKNAFPTVSVFKKKKGQFIEQKEQVGSVSEEKLRDFIKYSQSNGKKKGGSLRQRTRQRTRRRTRRTIKGKSSRHQKKLRRKRTMRIKHRK